MPARKYFGQLKYCECGCGGSWPVVDHSSAKKVFITHHNLRNWSTESEQKRCSSLKGIRVPREIRTCECGCKETFECKVTSKKRFIDKHRQRTFSPEVLESRRISLQKTRETPECKQKIAEANRKRFEDPEERRKISETMKKIRGTPEARREQSRIGAERVARRGVSRSSCKNTSCEILMKRFLVELQEEFVHQYLIDGLHHTYSTDFYLPRLNLIFETQSTYYHMDPRKYKATDYNHRVHLTAQEIWDKDAERKAEIESKGYRVFIFWYRDFNKESVQETILNVQKEMEIVYG